MNNFDREIKIWEDATEEEKNEILNQQRLQRKRGKGWELVAGHSKQIDVSLECLSHRNLTTNIEDMLRQNED